MKILQLLACRPFSRRTSALRGFTLVEVLVVVGLIGILATALVGSFGYLKTTAWQSRAQAQVSHTAAALTLYLQNNRSWPEALLGKKEFDKDVCAALQKNRIIDVTTWKDFNPDGTGKNLDENSPDRYGLLDPWGRATMRKNPQAKEDAVRNHRLQFRLDEDFDGYVDGAEGAPKGVSVRASAIVWSRGPDGFDDADGINPKAKARYPYDDRLSWSYDRP